MTVHASEQPATGKTIELGPLRGRIIGLGLVLAVVGLGAAVGQALMIQDGAKRFMFAYLVGFAYVLSLALGGLFFVLLQHLTHAGWSVLVRRVFEALSVTVLLAAVLFVPIGLSVAAQKGTLYFWAQPVSALVMHPPAEAPAPEAAPDTPDTPAPAGQVTPAAAHEGHEAGAAAEPHAAGAAEAAPQPDETLLKKRAWLNPQFFLLRWCVYLGFWALVAVTYRRQSVAQDHDADARRTQGLETKAGPLMVLFALTLTAAAFDLLMSLDPHWYSTMFGVYYFTGAVVAAFSAATILVLTLAKRGKLPGVTVEHQHDLGKLMFAFVFFWGYIAFSQYMLLWYANMPEATGWLRRRGAGLAADDHSTWSWLAVTLVVGHFIVPFAGLMSRHVKRNRGALLFWAWWLLVMHWCDLLWLVMPAYSPACTVGVMEIGATVGLLGLALATWGWVLGRASVIPAGDPRLGESLAFQNI